MKYYSTNSPSAKVDLRTAVLHSLPADRGLYMPESIPALGDSFFDTLDAKSFGDLAYEVAHPYLSADFSDAEIREITDSCTSFDAPVVMLDDQLSVLELWHGPSLAFKDFGARFMAAVMSRLVAGQDKKLTILVATSGDTGGAVASGFLGVDGVEVIILYPSGGVSPLQEKQLTTLGQNIRAIEVKGTFDDCQAMVKRAFLDQEINEKLMLSSANSINITRLIPQSFYYFNAYRQLRSHTDKDICFCVPSGNFGNVTAGVLAKRMGLPIHQFVAATNANDVVPRYLQSGQYDPHPSIATISNAMDVGAPSNFARLDHLYGGRDAMAEDFVGYTYSDYVTKTAIREIKDKYNYTMDPHGAVGYLAAQEYLSAHPDQHVSILETAHPAKFLPVMTPILGDIDVPERLAVLSDRDKDAHLIDHDYDVFKDWLLG